MKDLANIGKFEDPHLTAKGEARATVALSDPQTLWFNTGTLCNIQCVNCYIESSPKNDALVYLTTADVEDFLNQLEERNWGVTEIAFTGGEPYLNPYAIRLSEMALERGHSLLVLTNAMKPMMRKRVQAGLLDLQERFPGKMTLRVSLDHFSPQGHDEERGNGSFEIALKGMAWLTEHKFDLHIAGRAMFSENDATARAGYENLINDQGWDIDAHNPAQTILFPEMDEKVDVPEVSVACWSILDVHPDSMMCSSSRMIVRRKGEDRPVVLACTLLWDDPQFETGKTLTESLGPVALNHPHCSKFCVLGGASCSA